jgi:hypothetical protein
MCTCWNPRSPIALLTPTQQTTFVGNWQEERELRRSLLKDILSKKLSTSTRLDAYHQRMSTALAEVELTKIADDPFVHFGDLLQLVHVETGHVLAGDVGEQDPRPAEEACAATAAPEVRAPCARNTFVLLKYQPDRNAALEPFYEDDVLHYGQKIRLALNPQSVGEPADAAGGSRPLCLFSKLQSSTHHSKYGRKQLVGLTSRNTYETVWTVLTPDPSQRVISEGVEVMAGAPILLVHAATQKPLMVEVEQIYPNAFGNEWELSARQMTSHGLTLSLEQTSKGILKGTLPKGESSLNFWTFISGDKVEALPTGPRWEKGRSIRGREGECGGAFWRLLTWQRLPTPIPCCLQR